MWTCSVYTMTSSAWNHHWYRAYISSPLKWNLGSFKAMGPHSIYIYAYIYIYIYIYTYTYIYIICCFMDLGPRAYIHIYIYPIHLAGLMAFRSPGSKRHEWLRCVSRVAELSICKLLNKIKTRHDSAPIVFFCSRPQGMPSRGETQPQLFVSLPLDRGWPWA